MCRRSIGPAGSTWLARLPSRLLTALLWGLAPLYLLGTALAGHHLPEAGFDAITGLAMCVSQLIELVLVLRAALSRRLPTQVRAPWRWMAAEVAVQLAISIGFAGFATHQAAIEALAFLRLILGLLVTAAIFSFPSGRRSGAERLALTFDVAMIACAGLLVCWYFLIGPALMQGLPAFTLLFAVGAPIMDVVVVSGGALVLVRGAPARFRRPITMLACACALLAVPDLQMAFQAAHGQSAVGPGTPTLFVAASLIGAFSLIALAARASTTAGCAPDRAAGAAVPYLPYLPYLAVGLGNALLLVVAARSALYPWLGLAIGVVVMTGGLVARQLLPLLESRRLATTDSLTGLANRRGFDVALERALYRAARTGDAVALLLLDLNGFKEINDALGHAAGDAALTTFARVLHRDVLGSDTVARLGGDEFALVLGGIRSPGEAVIVAERIISDLGTPVRLAGRQVRLRASIGIVLSSPPDHDAEELLRRADLAMYEAKRQDARRGTTSTWRVFTPDLAPSQDVPMGDVPVGDVPEAPAARDALSPLGP